MTGLVTVVGGALGCGAGVCADVMEAIKAIATRAISAEIMRVFMRMILPAGSTASNEKAKREPEIGDQKSVKRGSARILRADRRILRLPGSERSRGLLSVVDSEEQAFLVAIARRMSEKFRVQGRPTPAACEF